MLTQSDLNAIGRLIEKKLTVIEEKLSKTATKRGLKIMENKIIERINLATDYFDEKIIDHEERIKNLENKYSISVA